MKLGTEKRGQTIAAIVLGIILLMIIAYQVIPSSSTNASNGPASTASGLPSPMKVSHPARRGSRSAAEKRERTPQSLDPILHLAQLAATEQIKYEGSGRNIFVAQAETAIPIPVTNGRTDGKTEPAGGGFRLPAVAPPPPIPLKFFGFASHPGEPKKIFLSKGDDVFIAAEGDIVDRRYKVVRIAPSSVEIQDLVSSGPPQNIPLTQG